MGVHVARLAELHPETLYALLRLRIDVFVVEQHCAYADLDGRDAEPATQHLWFTGNRAAADDRIGSGPGIGRADDSNPGEGSTDKSNPGEGIRAGTRTAERMPLGYLRLLTEPDGSMRIGRVCVSSESRGAGVAKILMHTALNLVGPRVCVLSAQSHLVQFYGRFGFTPCGAEYLDEGMPHTPMRRPAATP